jgi:hypothetical protein
VTYHADAGVSGKSVGPELSTVLRLLAGGHGYGLVVAKLDRLSRSIINAANIVVLDLNLDLTTAAGRMIAHQLMTFAQYERELISERTKAALAAKRACGERPGRQRLATPGRVRRIVMDCRAGLSFARGSPRPLKPRASPARVAGPIGRPVPVRLAPRQVAPRNSGTAPYRADLTCRPASAAPGLVAWPPG